MKLTTYLKEKYTGGLEALAAANTTQLQALLNAIVLTITADGRVDTRELKMIRGVLEPVPPLTERDLDAMLPKAVAFAVGTKADELEAALKTLKTEIASEDLLEVCFVLAVAATLADGVVVDFETRALAAFQAGFELHPHLALRVIGEVRNALA